MFSTTLIFVRTVAIGTQDMIMTMKQHGIEIYLKKYKTRYLFNINFCIVGMKKYPK